jgi:hypothetical protein
MTTQLKNIARTIGYIILIGEDAALNRVGSNSTPQIIIKKKIISTTGKFASWRRPKSP